MTFASAFNGGRSQTNFNFMQIGGEYPFINVLKTAQEWTYVDNSAQASPAELDANGYLTDASVVTNHGGIKTTFYVPTQAARSGNYVATWTGNGTIYVGSNNTLVSGSKTGSGGSGRYVFSTTTDTFSIGIAALPVTDLKVFHESDETALNAGEIFGVKFKQRLVEANFGVYRFLNWQQGNTTNATTYASLKSTSYVFYEGSEFRPGIYAGVAALTTTKYAVAAPAKNIDGTNWAGLAHGATVSIHFGTAISSACTLNVGATGDINVLDSYSLALSSGGNSYPVTGKLATLVYDSTLNAWIKWGGDAALGSKGIVNGCPLTLCFQLCAEMGAHPHFVSPHLSMDPLTDLMPTIAAYCRDNGPSWMIPRYEGPNELWNTFGQFFQTIYANNKAAAYGWPGYHDWYGKIISVLGQAISTVYSANRARYEVVCGVQTATGGSASSSDQRLKSDQYIAQAAAAQSPYIKDHAYNWVTAIATAQYWGSAYYGDPTETDLATEYSSATASRKTEIAAAYISGCNVTGGASTTVPELTVLNAAWKTWALGMATAIRKMVGYEGCYSPDYTGVPNSDALRFAGKSIPDAGAYLASVYANYSALTDANFTAVFPSNFIIGDFLQPGFYANGTTTYAWSIFLGDIWAAASPQWDAICRFNATKRANNLRIRLHG